MADIEKVIKGLENCIKGFVCPQECPYLDDCNDLTKPTFVELAKDALALMKEQEAVEPEIHLGSLSIKHSEPELTVYCGACKGEMVHKYSEFPIEYMKKQYKYCHHCGQAVKWE